MLEVGKIYNIDGTYLYLNRISTDGYGLSTTYEFERGIPISADIANITIDSEYISDNIDNYIYFKHQKEEDNEKSKEKDNEDRKEEDNFDEWLKLLGES